MEKLILKEDYIIPAGTEFELIPKGATTKYGDGNYEGILATSKDTTMTIQVNEDELNSTDLFKHSK